MAQQVFHNSLLTAKQSNLRHKYSCVSDEQEIITMACSRDSTVHILWAVHRTFRLPKMTEEIKALIGAIDCIIKSLLRKNFVDNVCSAASKPKSKVISCREFFLLIFCSVSRDRIDPTSGARHTRIIYQKMSFILQSFLQILSKQLRGRSSLLIKEIGPNHYASTV